MALTFFAEPASAAPPRAPAPPVVHAAWRPPSEHGSAALVLWAEGEGQGAVGARGRTGGRHPEALGVPALRDLLPDPDPPPHETGGTASLWLPTRDGAPLSSRTAAASLAAAPLQPWTVPALLLRDGEGALTLLAAASRRLATAGAEAGTDLLFWIEASRTVLGLLAHGRFRPAMDVEAGWARAVWALAPDPSWQRALDALAASAPPAAFCYGPPTLPPRLDTALGLQSFARVCADGFARRALRGENWTLGHRLPDGPAGRWTLALTAPPGRDSLGRLHADLDLLVLCVRLGRAVGPEPARLVLRLLPPPDAGANEAGAAPPAIPGAWSLDCGVVQRSEPDAWLPAAAVLGGGPDGRAGRAGPDPALRPWLEEWLSVARLVFPPLDRLSPGPGASPLALAAAEVEDFVRRAAPVLLAAGCGVEVPRGLAEARTAHVAARLHLASPPTGAFAPEALVDFSWRVSLGGRALSPAEFQALVTTAAPWVRMGEEWVAVAPQDLERLRRLWAARSGRLPAAGALRLALEREAAAAADLPVQAVRATGWLRGVLAGLRGGARLVPVPPPPGLRATLRPYQERGLTWLAHLAACGLGACLADDMGLGKTVQALALLVHRREQGLARGPSLVICPASLLANWQAEAARFAPDLRLVLHHGPSRARGAGLAAAVGAADLCLTSYETAARDSGDLAAVDWDGVLLDEAQRVKNPHGHATRALRRLPARYRVVLTGTPVENTVAELWSHFAFLLPGYLGSLAAFRRRYSGPVERGADPARVAELRRLTGPFVLRRRKSDPDVAPELPPRIVSRQLCPLTAEQAALYQAVLERMQSLLHASRGIARRGLVLATLTRLKQVCNHPEHLLRAGGAMDGRSGKLARCLDLLAAIRAAGEQALVFTQFATFGRRLAEYLSERLGEPAGFLCGDTPLPERQRLVGTVQAGQLGVCVLSLRAGGVGLNLHGASHVLHYDRWWNPAVEDQATDRAHRIGQRRTVQVHLLIARGTLEERIDRLLEDKRALAERAVGSGEAWLTELSDEELGRLLGLDVLAGEAVTP